MIVVSFYITYISGVMDFLVSTDDSEEMMKGFRVFFELGVVMWQHFFLCQLKIFTRNVIIILDKYRN